MALPNVFVRKVRRALSGTEIISAAVCVQLRSNIHFTILINANGLSAEGECGLCMDVDLTTASIGEQAVWVKVIEAIVHSVCPRETAQFHAVAKDYSDFAELIQNHEAAKENDLQDTESDPHMFSREPPKGPGSSSTRESHACVRFR